MLQNKYKNEEQKQTQMNLLIISFILLGHLIGDFILQENKQKPSRDKKLLNKIKKTSAYLITHTIIYTSVFSVIIIGLMLFGSIKYSMYNLLLFSIITYITHFLVDLLVTLINSNFLSKNARHKYFVSIGIDQFIHYLILFSTTLLILL